MRTIAFSENYELLLSHEDIWLKFLKAGKAPMRIARFIGGCNSAVISSDEKYIIVAGFGLLVIDLELIQSIEPDKSKKPIRIYFRDSKTKFWISKVWQDRYNENVFGFISNLRPYYFTLKANNLVQLDIAKSKSWAEIIA